MAVIDEVKILVQAEVSKAIADLNKTEKASGSLRDSFKKLQEVMQGPVAAAKDIYAVFNKVVDVFGGLYNEFADAELAAIKLNAALANSENMADGASDRLSAYADELQNVSIFEGDNTKAIIANLAAMGRSEDQITSLISAASNLASATGQDLDSAVTQLNATLNGNAGILGRQNGAIRALTEEQLKNGDAVKLISEQYKGFNEKVAQSASGSVKQLENSFGDLKETIGQTVAISFQPMIASLNEAVKSMNEQLITSKLTSKAKMGEKLTYEEMLALQKELTKNAGTYISSNSISDQILYAQLGKLEKQIELEEKRIEKLGQRKTILTDIIKITDADTKAGEKSNDKEKKSVEELEKARQQALEESARKAAELEEELANVDLNTGTWLYLAEMQGEGADEASRANAENMKLVETLSEEDKAAQELSETYKKLGEIVSSTLTSSFVAFGDALVSGEDPVKAFLKTLINAIGDSIIAFAALTEAQGWATFPVVDFTKVGAGIALAVTGIAVKASASALAQGGIVTGPTHALIGENGPEAVIPLRGNNSMTGMGTTNVVNQYIQGSILSEKYIVSKAAGAMYRNSRGY